MKTTVNFKKRLVSGLLALTMVLGFLPANLFPAANAADGDLRIDSFVVDDKGHYTLKLSYISTVGNWGGTYLAVAVDAASYDNVDAPSTSVGSGKDFTVQANTPVVAEGILAGYGLTTGMYTTVMLTSPKSTDTSGARPVYTFEGDLTAKSGGAFTMAALKSAITGGNYYQSGTKLDGSTVPLFAFVRLAAPANVAGKSSTMVGALGLVAEPSGFAMSRSDSVAAKLSGTGWTGSNKVTVKLQGAGSVKVMSIKTNVALGAGTIGAYFGSDTSTSSAMNGALTNLASKNLVFSTDTGGTTSTNLTLWVFSGTATKTEQNASAQVSEYKGTIEITYQNVVDGSPDGTNRTLLVPYSVKRTGNPKLTPDSINLSMTVAEAKGAALSKTLDTIALGLSSTASIDSVWLANVMIATAPASPVNNYIQINPSFSGGATGVEIDKTTKSQDITFKNKAYSSATIGTYTGQLQVTFRNQSAAAGATTWMDYIPITLTITDGTVTKYDVSFNLNGAPGTAPATQNIAAGGTVSEPADPSWDANHAFGGWYKEAACTNAWNFDTDTVTADTTLYAKWTAQRTITFDPNKPGTAASSSTVTNMPASMTVAQGDTAKYPTKEPKLLGYRFLGWSQDKTDTTATWTNTSGAPVMGDQDLKYFAIWEAAPVTLADMVFSAKQDETPVLDPTGGDSKAVADDHADPVNHFEYKLSANKTGPWADSFTWEGATFQYVGGVLTAGTSTLGQAVKTTFYVKATSKLNGEVAIAKVTLQVPPRINGGSMAGDMKPGKKVDVEKLTLTGGGEIPSADFTWADIDAVEWYLGYDATMVGSTNTSEQGPEMKKKITGATAKDSVTIPTDAKEGIHLWMKVTGDDVDVDAGVVQVEGGGKAIWVDMGSIGKERRQIKVVPSAWDGSTKVSTLPNGISWSATPGRLGEGENGQISTISTNTEYEFVGWNLTDSTTGTFTGSKTSTTDGKWTVTGEGVALPNGRNSATISIEKLPTGEPITVYAIYKKVTTYTITVKGDNNIETVKGGGQTASGTKGFTLTVKATDTVTLNAIPKANCVNNGFTVTLPGGGNATLAHYDQIASDMKSTVTLKAKADIVVTFAATAVADLHATGVTNIPSGKVGSYSTSDPVYTVTLENKGALAATIENPADVKLYTAKGGTTASTDFTIKTRPGSSTIGAGKTEKYEITPVANLTPGAYTAWLHIKETTIADTTKNGAPLDLWFKITFVVTDKDTFTGKVTVKLNGAATSAGVTQVVAKSGNDPDIAMTGSGGVYTTAADALSVGKTYNVLINGEDTGYVLHAAAKEQEINFYTLTKSVSPAGAAVAPGETLASGKKITGLGYIQGAVGTMTANTPTGAYVFDHWTETTNGGTPDNTKTSKVVSIIMSGQKDVVANYVATVTRTYDYGYSRTGGRTFYTQSGLKSGTAYGAITLVPSRPGYTFDKWVTTDGGTTEVNFAAKLTADQTVYAHWTQVKPSWSTLPPGEYGKGYVGTAAITSGNVGSVTYAISSFSTTSGTAATSLADLGLTFDTTTGMIGKSDLSKKPIVAGTYSLTVKATNSDGGEWTHDYDLIINKATPVITGVQYTVGSGKIVTGTPVANLRIDATVTAPYWNGTTWGTGSHTFTYTVYDPATGATAPGRLAITEIDGNTPGTNLDFSTKTTLPAEIKLTPGTVGGTNYGEIYNEATGLGYINQGSEVYSFTAVPSPVTFTSIGSDKVDTDAAFNATKTVTITNTSSTSTTGYFSFTLEDAAGNTYPTTGAEFTVTGMTDNTMLDTGAGKTATLTVSLVGGELAGEIGDHMVFIHIVEKDKATDGETKAEARVPVTLTITAAPFTGTVTTKLHKTNNTSALGDSGRAVTLRKLGGTTSIAATASGGGSYTFSTGLTAVETYTVWIDGIQVPNLYITKEKPSVEVDLYEVAFAVAPVGGSTTGMTGAGYYLENESVGISAPDTQNIGGKTYTFAKWTTGDLGTTTELFGATTAFRMPANAVTMTANYSEPAADTYTVTYDPGVAGTSVAVPVDTRQYKTNDTVTVSSMTPVWPGYTFDGWSGAPGETGNVAAGSPFTMGSANVTLTAQWTKVSGLTWTESLPTGTYGSDYHGSVALKDTSATGAVEYSATGLPGGLTMATDGTITGKPYIVGNNMAITVTATSTVSKDGDGNWLTWTYTLGKITVNKAVPTLVVKNATGAVVGQSYKEATYVVDVKVPKWDGGTNWSEATYSYTTDAGTATKTGISGTLTIPDTTADKFKAGTNTVPLSWTPSDDTSADSNRNKYSAIYEPGTVNAILGADGTYGITADPIANTWTVKERYTVNAAGTDGTVDTTTNTANALQVTIQNIGSQATGDLTLKLGTDSKFELGTGITSPVSSIDKDGSVTITVQPKAGVTEGVYTDTLTIENTTTKVKATVALTLVVTQADEFGFSINTYLNSAADPTVRTKDNVPGGIVLRPVSGGADVTPSTPTTAGEYKWTGLKSNMSYSVVVNGHVTTHVVTVNTDPKSMDIDLYQVILKQDPANTGATLQLTNASSTGAVSGTTTVSYYYVPGQPYQASTNVPSDKAFVKWTRNDHTLATSSTPVDDSTSSVNYRVMATTPMTLTANFVEEVKYEIQLDTTDSTFAYDAGKGLGDILNGGTLANDKYMVDDGATFGISVPMDGLYSITKAGHTFRGWATTPSATVGAYAFTANTAADKGDNNEDRIITLYPVWTEDSNLALAPGVIKGVYKHELVGQQVGPATGGTEPYGFAPMTGLPFGLALGSQTAGTVPVNGKPNDVGTDTATITVTDKAGATATADYAFVIEKADMKLKDADKPKLTTGVSVTVGDNISTAINGVLTGIKPDGDGTEEINISGAWQVGDVSGLTKPGTYYVPVTYVPENGTGDHAKDKDHYNDYETTIKVTVEAKLITAADIGVTIPAAGNKPDDKNSVVKTSLVPAAATFATDVDVAEVFWSPAPSGNFVAGTAYTVTVVLKIKTGSDYRFDVANFAGQINTTGARKISTTEDTATFSYTFPAEDAKINSVNVLVDTLGTGNSNPSVNSAEAYKYKVTDKKWVETSDAAGNTPITDFNTGTNYDLIVTFTAEDGYVFNDAAEYFGGTDPSLQIDGKWIAMVNSKDSGADAKTAKVTTVLSADKKTITIRFSSFTPQEKTIQGVTASGDLGIYYVNMGANMHHDAAATGHKNGVDFVFSPAGLTVNAVYRQADGQMTAPEALGSAAYELWVGTPEAPGSVKIWDGTTGRTFVKDGTDDDRALDGKRVYLKTKEGNLTTQVGQLTVKELWVKSMKDTDDVKPNLIYTVGDNFATAPAGAGATKPTVSFNTDTTALKNDVTLTGYGADDRNNNTPTNYFFALNADGTDELTDATKMTATHNGKTVYVCYADVNDHVVSTPVGTLKIKSDNLTVTVDDANKHDPEYGDKLTAEPNGGDGNYSYQWEKKNPDGTWTPIPGATGQDYIPGKDDVDETIRVTVKDSTGAEKNSDPMEIQPRSLNFVVAPWDKIFDTTDTNIHKYDANDFTLKIVPAAGGQPAYGGVLLGDMVTLTPDAGWNDVPANRPGYVDDSGNASAAVGSTITWPAVEVNAGTGANQTGGYTVGGTDGNYYRLAGQEVQTNRGKINPKGLTTVSHVDVSFKEVPTYSHAVPVNPMAVTDMRETWPGEASAAPTVNTDFTATWYTGFTDLDNPGTKVNDPTFGAGTYTVVVQVKPNTAGNYIYKSGETAFNFHFGESKHVVVTPVERGGVYYMIHTFDAVEKPKIAHVNVSVDQPVVEVAPKTTVTENQVLGTDGSDRKDDLTPGAITWTPSTTQFAGDTAYTAKFDLTAENGFEFDDNVKFVVNGVGPFAAGDTGASSNIITKVTAKKDDTNDKIYHIEVTFAQLKGGKVDLTDVVVDASVPAENVEKTGPEVVAEKRPIYDLKADSTNKWQYWNTATKAWDDNIAAALTDGKFLAGYDYRVTATVELKDTTHYQIGTNTKFYLAGQECKTNVAADLHGGSDMTLTKKNDTTYTLIQEFSVPANGIGMITVTYDLPLNSGTSVPDAPEAYGDTNMVNIAGNATTWVKLGTEESKKNDFDAPGSAPGTTFEESQYYRVTSVVTPETGYKFTTGTVVVINGVPVTVGNVGEVKENGTTVAYVKAVKDGDNIKTMLIAKVRSTAIDPIELKHADITPVAEMAPSSELFALAKDGEARYEVDTAVHNGGKGTWEYEKTPGNWVNATVGNGLDANGNFLSGTKYRVTVGVKAKGTNVFATGASGTVDNTANSTKKNATVAVAGDRKTATLTVTFDPTNISTVTVVDVYFNRQPEVGKTVGLQESGNYIYKFPASVNNAPTETVGTLAGTGMEQFEVKWYDTTDVATFDPATNAKTAMGDADKFGAHKKYTVTVRVKPAAGWQYILDNDPGTVDTKFTIFASDAGHTSYNVWYDAAHQNYVMWYTFTTYEDPSVIVRVAANVAHPVAGAIRPSTVAPILAQNQDNDDMLAHVTVGNPTWKVSDTFGSGYVAASGTTFEANKYYQATFTVSADAANGYSFLNTDPDYVKFLVNGIGWINGAGDQTENDIKVTTTGNGNNYTVTVEFPVTGSIADVYTVLGIAMPEPEADKLITNSPLTVPGTEPYEVVPAGTKWQHQVGNSWEEVKVGDKFLPGHTYKAIIQTQIKPANAGKYRFTDKTDGYINGTAAIVTRTEGTGTAEHPQYITLEREFTVPKVQTPVEVHSDRPVTGQPLPTAITEGDNTKYAFTSAVWSGDLESGNVKAGTTYTLTVTVEPKDGYTLPANAGGYTWAENGTVANSPITNNGDGTYTVKFTYTTLPDGAQPLDPVIAVREPVKGATPGIPTSPNNSVTIKGHTWTDAGNNPVSTFAAGKSYTIEVEVDRDRPDGTGNYAAGQTIKFNTYSETIYERDGKLYVKHTWSLPADPPPEIIPGPGGSTTITEELPVVTYWISDHGFTNDLTAEKMSRSGAKPTFVPNVSGKEGYKFKGWSETDPSKLKQGEELKLVDPLTFSIKEDKTFYAVYEEPRFEHDHYVSGYPDGTFKPEQYITRAEVAAIVANACLDGFDNNENYGNPGNYSDVNPKKWYGNDIAYCTMYGVFNGYKDGTFKPDQYITRQELAVVVANMAGMQTNIGMPFTDADSINKWARDGVYTVYKNNWVSGYPDGTFRPKNNITRAETVAIFNGYLHRGVDKEGLAELTPYVLNAAAGGYQGDGSSLYMTWTDVPEKYWAYYHIIEAANDHDYHWPDEETQTPPEHWDAAYIDQEWRYREEFAVTYAVGDYGTALEGSVLNLSVKSGGRPRTLPHIDAHEGYTFLGWSLTPDGAIVEPLQTTITGATTFYAVYEVETTRYTVRYDAGANGALAGGSSEQVAEGRNPAHMPAVNAHEGYTFLGWAETPNGTVVSPADVAITADKTFYAVYRADQPAVQLQSHTAYMSGYDDGTFRPSQAITRAEVVAMVVRALGTDYDPSHVYDTSSVTDVEGHSAQNMIGYCIEKGIFSGYKDGTFLPEGTMTRQEFAVVIANLAGGAQENQGLPFTDADKINKWARNAVYTVYVNGWIGGYKDGSFQPKNNITRAEAAVIFNGFLGRNVDKTSLTDVPAGATSPWSDVKVKNWAYQNIMEATADHSYYLEDGVERWAEP